MKVLVINCGSSSLKYQVFDMTTETVLAKGIAEKIGLEGSFLKYRRGDEDNITITSAMPNHEVAVKLVFDALTDAKHGVLKDVSEIEAVGHRVVHGGEFARSVVIDDEVMGALRDCIDLAPLHNPPNIVGIEVAKRLMPNVTHVGVFDTAFHQTIPDYAFLYALPYELYQQYGVRRYGFHGTSHLYVAGRAAAMLNRPAAELKVITCHLGNGASITAVDGGRSVDTSMGFTPLEGLIMGTRSGDVDPAVVSFLANKEGLTAEQVVNTLLNKKSGVLGISGVSSDFRAIEDAAADGNKRAGLSIKMFAYRVRKYIGAYAAAMGGVDAIVFTAGLGENSADMREQVCAGLGFLGVQIDYDKNNVRGQERDVSTADSKVRVLLIPTNEELVIARDTVSLARG